MVERKGPQFAPGSKGTHIFELQEQLRAAGQADAPSSGVFDRATRKSLSAFQKRTGLRATGDVDGQTLAALAKAAAPAEPPAPPPVEERTEVEVDRIDVPDGPGFPLQKPLELVLERRGDDCRAILALGPGLTIEGRGPTLEAARGEVGRGLAKLVHENWRVPPHARNREQARAREALAAVLDWPGHKRESPPLELVVGRLDGAGPSAGLKVHWLLGPGAVRRQDVILPAGDQHPAFTKLVGGWFTGKVRRRSGALEWVEAPRATADPLHQETAQRVWLSLPRRAPVETGGWPELPPPEKDAKGKPRAKP
ncbi:MAG TPA: peptidoglycan-binding domain-containing protein [Planctomycetota bacterium]|nr:peptidoglycan-binding domain-containing protein [Planctomycetota bacterium]